MANITDEELKMIPLFDITIPSKKQAYMAVGKPLLMAFKGEAAALGTLAQCGCRLSLKIRKT